MKLIASLIGAVLISIICSLIFTVVAHKTILNPDYFKNKIAKTNITEDLSQTLPSLISQQTGQTVKPEMIQNILSSILTPQNLQGKADDSLNQFKSFLTQNGAPPQLDLTDLATQARANGIHLPDDFGEKPITLPDSTATTLKSSYDRSIRAERINVIALVTLLSILLLMCIKEKNYKPIIGVFMISAILQLILFVFMKYSPYLIVRYVPTSSDATIQNLITTLEKFTWSVLGDMSLWFAWFAAGLFIIALFVYALSFISRTRHKLKLSPKST